MTTDELYRAALVDANGDAKREGPRLDDAVVDRLASVGHRLRPWPDAVAALRALSAKYLLVALSNANMSLLADMTRHGGLTWHCTLSGELVRAHKPDPAVYRLAIDLLGLDPARTLMVAAHPWDLRAAATHGLRAAYIRRAGEGEPEPTDRFDLSVDDLSALAHALGATGDASASRPVPAVR
jgi:2-haloacid dehalogenase